MNAAVVFSKGSSKTLDMNKLSYILNYAQITYHPVPESRVQQSRKKRTLPSIMVTPSIGSSDAKTFTEKLLRQSQRRPSSSSPPPPSRPAQVVVDTVSSFYQEDPFADSGSPSSHNAVVDNMSPAMRRTLKARRIRVRGGGRTNGFMERLEVGLYFTLWYALNVIYNSTYPSYCFLSMIYELFECQDQYRLVLSCFVDYLTLRLLRSYACLQLSTRRC